MSAYSKAIAAAIVAALVAGATAAQAVIGDGWSAQDTLIVLVAFLGPIAVYLAPPNTVQPAVLPLHSDENEEGSSDAPVD